MFVIYLLFAGEQYYPGGGFYDLVGQFDTYEAAERQAIDIRHGWWHIVRIDADRNVDIIAEVK